MMKKILLTASVMMILFSAKSQVAKNSWLLGGVLGYNDNSYSQGSSSNTNLAPRISYAVGSNSVAGIKGEYSYSSSKEDDGDKITGHGIAIMAFFRKYYPIRNKFGWYAEASGGIGKSSGKYDMASTNQKSETTSKDYILSLTPGIFYNASRNILLNLDFAGLKYTHTTSENTSTTPQKTKSSYFGVRFLSYFSFGVDFVL